MKVGRQGTPTLTAGPFNLRKWIVVEEIVAFRVDFRFHSPIACQRKHMRP